ncbi:MAG: heme-binding protein [Caulobacterales bacterium]|nr:heme-binding protein [Caulobacterales bacterium]
MRLKPTLEFADADIAAEACRRKALELGAPVTIAVVDEAGQLLSLQRLDGARGYSVDLAHRKARTAAAIGLPTSVLEQRVREGLMSPGPDVLALGGGLPILHEGQCAGAIGVSGSTSDVDDQVAAAGLAAVQAAARASGATA